MARNQEKELFESSLQGAQKASLPLISQDKKLSPFRETGYSIWETGFPHSGNWVSPFGKLGTYFGRPAMTDFLVSGHELNSKYEKKHFDIRRKRIK